MSQKLCTFIYNIEASVKKANAEKIKQSLLNKVFREELVEHDPNDEPVSQLLKKIRPERDNQLVLPSHNKRKNIHVR